MFIETKYYSKQDFFEKKMKYFLIDIINSIKFRVSRAIVDEWNDEKCKDISKPFFFQLSLHLFCTLKRNPWVLFSADRFIPLFHSFCSSFVNMKIAEQN